MSDKLLIFCSHSFNGFDNALDIYLMVKETFVVLILLVLLNVATHQLQENIREDKLWNNFILD